MGHIALSYEASHCERRNHKKFNLGHIGAEKVNSSPMFYLLSVQKTVIC